MEEVESDTEEQKLSENEMTEGKKILITKPGGQSTIYPSPGSGQSRETSWETVKKTKEGRAKQKEGSVAKEGCTKQKAKEKHSLRSENRYAALEESETEESISTEIGSTEKSKKGKSEIDTESTKNGRQTVDIWSSDEGSRLDKKQDKRNEKGKEKKTREGKSQKTSRDVEEKGGDTIMGRFKKQQNVHDMYARKEVAAERKVWDPTEGNSADTKQEEKRKVVHEKEERRWKGHKRESGRNEIGGDSYQTN